MSVTEPVIAGIHPTPAPLPPAVNPGPATAPDPRQRRDRITGLWQEDWFCHQLGRWLTSPRPRPVPMTLALLQLENFYEIRGWVGTSEAELLLGEIAQALRKTVPANSRLCRCRNNEFAVLLLGNGSRGALTIANKIRVAAQRLAVHLIPPQLSMACAVGLATVDTGSRETAVLFARARHDLARRQQQRLQITPVPGPDAADAANLLSLLKSALASDDLQLAWQAVVSLRTPAQPHYQLSVGLPVRDSLLPAARFIETAVQFAMGEALDRWVLTRTLQWLQQQPDPALHCTVHLSRNSVTGTSLGDWLRSLPPAALPLLERLVLQVSEIDLLISQHHMPGLCELLREYRLRLAIGHFGCTPGSRQILTALRPALVSLDGGLLRNAEQDLVVRQELTELAREAQGLQIQVRAAGVEKLRIVPWLWQCGVVELLGHAIHRPAAQADYSFLPPLHYHTLEATA